MIKQQFEKHKISQMQLDPFGVCNAKCWFCPVKYKGNPAEGKEVMSIELLEKIIVNLLEERSKENGLVSKSFNGFYTAHYNEILLYPHFEEMLKLCKKYKLHTLVLTNGIPMTPEKTDLIKQYPEVITGVCFNTPAFEADIWSKRSGINIKQFDKLINNIKYATENLPDLVRGGALSIQVNGVNENSFSDRGGWLDKGLEFPTDINLDQYQGELITQANLARKIFPGVQVY
jgi:wyosine [tRNA(Phe)-imidazoG37] synthetase (radical SAM superfamily)